MPRVTLNDYKSDTGIKHDSTVKKYLERCFGSASKRPTVQAFRKKIIKALQDAAGGREKQESSLDLDQQRARKEKAMADKIERENLMAEGKLVEAEEVRAMNAEVAGVIRSNMLAIPSRLAGELSGVDEPREIQAVLDEAIRRALSTLENDR